MQEALEWEKELTATNVTCTTAPSADTDVVRKVDVRCNTVATLSGEWQDHLGSLTQVPNPHCVQVWAYGVPEGEYVY